MAEVQGFARPGYEAVAEAFTRNIDEGREVGAEENLATAHPVHVFARTRWQAIDGRHGEHIHRARLNPPEHGRVVERHRFATARRVVAGNPQQPLVQCVRHEDSVVTSR